MEEIDKRQMSRGHALAAVVAMEVEEVTVIAGSNLRLDIRDCKLLHVQLGQNLRQRGFNALQHHILMLLQVRQYA